jgi:hypothetical protein
MSRHRSYDIGARWATCSREETSWFKAYLLAVWSSCPTDFAVRVTPAVWSGNNALEVIVRTNDAGADVYENLFLLEDGSLHENNENLQPIYEAGFIRLPLPNP